MDKYFTYQGIRLHYTLRGAGQPLFLLHGWGCDGKIWERISAFLEQHFQLYTFDFAGFGRTIFAYPDFAADILRDGTLKKEKLCLCCSKCTELMRSGSTPGCVIRDPLYTKLYKEHFNK